MKIISVRAKGMTKRLGFQKKYELSRKRVGNNGDLHAFSAPGGRDGDGGHSECKKG